MNRLIAILAKRPTPGRVKTRLAQHVGPECAARFAEAFLLDTLETASEVPDASVLVAFDPKDAESWFREHAPSGCELMLQPNGDLGPRLQSVFEHPSALRARACVAVGMDTPQLSPARLGEALDACADGSVAVGPSVDGGYYLIGMDRPRPALFEDVAWSTNAVFAQTAQRIKAAGAHLALLPEEHDVDDLGGLQALDIRRLRPRSRAVLSAFRGARE